MKRFNLIILAVLVMAACGHKSPEPTKQPEPVDKGSAATTPPPPDTGAGSGSGSAAAKVEEPPPPPPKPHEDTFIKMSTDEKTKIMKTKVMPAMAKIFKDHDAKKFGKFDCKSCHGKGAGKGFKMPNPDLPKLDFKALHEGTADKKTMEMAKWMGEVVEPEMAKILELEAFDPAHPELGGFGCLACHEMKK